MPVVGHKGGEAIFSPPAGVIPGNPSVRATGVFADSPVVPGPPVAPVVVINILPVRITTGAEPPGVDHPFHPVPVRHIVHHPSGYMGTHLL